MIDMRRTVVPKSDQLNADDLIGQTRTIKITKVSLLEAADQPIAINFEGDGGKPYKPCKSMRRVLIIAWGDDGHKFVGRSMTLFRDEKVLFGGFATGGIRISHLSDIDEPLTMALTATRASRKPYTVKPLVLVAETPADAPPADAIAAALAEGELVASEADLAALRAFLKRIGRPMRDAIGTAKMADWQARVEANARTADTTEREPGSDG